MLEILSHQYLKKFVKSHSINWVHIYAFGRIISQCIQNNATYLINSEIFSTKDWTAPILIALFLKQEDSTFVSSNEIIEFLKNNQIRELKNLGFKYILEKDEIIFPHHRVRLITLKNLLNDPKLFSFKNHRFVLSGIEDINQGLKKHIRISLFKEDWINGFSDIESINHDLIRTYNFLKGKFLLRKVLGNSYIFLEQEEISFLSDFFYENSFFSNKFSKVSNALSQGWGCWVKLDNQNLDWIFVLEPLDKISQVRDFLSNNKFVFLSALRKDKFFQKNLKKLTLDIDLVINFKSNFIEQKISLYVPPKQMLPNNPLFTDVILEKCEKLILFRKGLTLLLLDDVDLKKKLATKLASNFGKRVLMQTMPSCNNEIICSSYKWWIKNSYLIECPEQIIVPLLPIPNMSEPINLITVSHNKKLSKDWFREFLLPEAIVTLERSIAPLRRNSGKLIILDGRANKRQWGRLLLQSIQPSTKINYMLPFD